MSELTSDILQQFANMVIGNPEPEKTRTIYGVIVDREGQHYVQLDGTESLSPLKTSVELEEGDRVLLQFEDRELTAIGNITAPGSARTLSKFMKLTDNGLMIGELEKGSPEGTYALLGPDALRLINKDGRVMAEFTQSAINFGNKATFGEDGVTLRDGDGNVLATFKNTGIDFGNKAHFGSDGVNINNQAFFNNNGLILQDLNGNVLAVFNINGVSFPDSASFTPNQIDLGQNKSVINIGKDDNGKVILQISKDSIESFLSTLFIRGVGNIQLVSRKNDGTYTAVRIGNARDGAKIDQEIDIWANNNGSELFRLRLNNELGCRWASKNGKPIYSNNRALATEAWVTNNFSKKSDVYSKNQVYTKTEVDDIIARLKNELG